MLLTADQMAFCGASILDSPFFFSICAARPYHLRGGKQCPMFAPSLSFLSGDMVDFHLCVSFEGRSREDSCWMMDGSSK